MAIVLQPCLLKSRPVEYCAGLKIPVTERAAAEIPALWQAFMAQQFNSAGENTTFGLCIAGQNGTDYMAAMPVQPGVKLPPEWVQITIPAARYAVFPHVEPVWRLRETIEAIFAPGGLPYEHQPLNNLAFFERYTVEFNSHTGMGGMSIWVPIKNN